MNRPHSEWDHPLPDYEVVVTDVAFLAIVPILVLLVQFLASVTTKSRLTHEIGAATPLSLFGHAYVHFSLGGLLSNVLGYVVLVVVGYALAIRMGERAWYLLSLTAILVTVPVLTGITDGFVFGSVAPSTTVSVRGLSSVVAAVGGLLFVVYLGLLRRVYDFSAAVLGGSALAIALEAGFADGYATVPWTWVYALPMLAFAIVCVEGLRRSGWSPRRVGVGPLRTVVTNGTVVTAVLLAAVVVLFPDTLFVGGRFTNVMGHAVGWTGGAVVSWWGHRYWTDVSWM